MNYQERLFRSRYGFGCEPTTLLAIGLAISAAGSVATVEGQRRAANAQTDYQQEQVKANNLVAAEQMGALRSQEAQTKEAQARETEKARQASRKASSTAYVASGEAGVTGNSVDAMLQEYSANLGQFKEATARQGALNSQATGAQISALKTGARFQNLQINAPVVGPNYAAEALRFGSSAMGSVAAYNPNAFKKK